MELARIRRVAFGAPVVPAVLPNVTGSGVTNVIPLWTDGPSSILGNSPLSSTGGSVSSSVPFTVNTSSTPQFNIFNSGTGTFSVSTTSTGVTTFSGTGAAVKVNILESVTVQNDASTTFAVRRDTGGGVYGLAMLATDQGTTFTVNIDTTLPATGFRFTPASNWLTGKYFDFTDHLGSSLMFMDVATKGLGFLVPFLTGTVAMEFGNAALTLHNNFSIATQFTPKIGAATGVPAFGYATAAAGAYFGMIDNVGATAKSMIGGVFTNNTPADRVHDHLIGAVFQPWSGPLTPGPAEPGRAHGLLYGWIVKSATGAMNTNATAGYGGYIEDLFSGATPSTPLIAGLGIAQQTRGTTSNNALLLEQTGAASTYKALAFRDQDSWINSRDAAHLDVNATTSVDINIGTTEQVAFTSGLATFKDTFDIAVGTGTGTKIGTATTQKLGLWNVAPVIQPAGAMQAALTNSSGGTYDGTIAALAAVGVDIVNAASQADVNARMATINDNFTEVYELLHAMRTAMVNFGSMKGAA
jgi:hypothetical protein